ncbi:MAG: hypothetical protein ACE5G1_01360 [bacterium]
MAKKKKSKKPQQKNATTSNQSNVVIEYLNKHPNSLPLTILAVLLLIFFHEVAFGGKTLLAPDKLNSISGAPFIQDALARGIYPQWCPYMFSGMPSFASLYSAPFVDVVNNLFWLIRKVVNLPDFYRIGLNYFLFGLFTYILLLRKTGVRLVGLFAGVAMIFQPPVIAFSAFGHNSKLGVAILIPIIFLLLDDLLNKRQVKYLALLALVVGVQLLRAHTQMSYYTFMLMGFYMLFWIVDSLRQKKSVADTLKPVSLVVIALILGATLSAWLYIPVQEYAHYSIRGGSTGLDYNYATSWSFSPKEMLTFLVPSFVGFGGQTYWGNMPFTDYPMYMGIITLFFAGLAVMLRRDQLVWFFVVTSVLALLISFGHNLPILYDPLFKLLPFFNKFRVPSMILILLQFSIVLLAALGLNALMNCSEEAAKQKTKKYTYVFGAVCGAVTLFLMIGKDSYIAWTASSAKHLLPQNGEAAYQNAVGDAVRMFFMLAAGGLLTLSFLKDKIKTTGFGAAIITLLVIDLWWVDYKIIDPQPNVNQEKHFTETEVVKFLKSQQQPFRILPVVDDKPGNWYMYFKIQNVKGYHAAKLKSYQTFLERTGLDSRDRFGLPPFLSKYLEVVVNDGKPALQRIPSGRIAPERFLMDNAVVDMLNVKYLISYYPIPDERYKQVVNNQPSVYENTGVLPRAFFVDEVKVVDDDADFYALLKSGNLDPAKTAILEETPEMEIVPSTENRVEITS